MPKSPSRTSKKKKYNARFPPARIKKIMQTDEDVGKVAAAVPVIISRALELFIESLISETSKTTVARNAKTLSSSHIKQTIESNKQFDFLRDLVVNIPDHQTEDDCNTDNPINDTEPLCKKARGRPKKMKEECGSRRLKGESSKASLDKSENTLLHLKEKEDDEDEDDDEDDEDTETDEENSSAHSAPVHNSDRLNYAQELPSKPAPFAFMNNIPNINSGFPPHLNNPALSSLQKQQQLLQSSEQFQHQFPSSTMPYPYPTSVNVAHYPLPPQYSSSLSSPQQNVPSQQPQHYDDQQQQPMNLSFSSRVMATTAGENDDYDT
ncbi:hypothetical protein Btru_024177 [Bulinus truncatus]|nr:hypothetical protein Btru_024177 [Bulinus truncatus]